MSLEVWFFLLGSLIAPILQALTYRYLWGLRRYMEPWIIRSKMLINSCLLIVWISFAGLFLSALITLEEQVERNYALLAVFFLMWIAGPIATSTTMLNFYRAWLRTFRT